MEEMPYGLIQCEYRWNERSITAWYGSGGFGNRRDGGTVPRCGTPWVWGRPGEGGRNLLCRGFSFSVSLFSFLFIPPCACCPGFIRFSVIARAFFISFHSWGRSGQAASPPPPPSWGCLFILPLSLSLSLFSSADFFMFPEMSAVDWALISISDFRRGAFLLPCLQLSNQTRLGINELTWSLLLLLLLLL